MDAFRYFQEHGQDVCTKVARRARTNWPYFKQFVYGSRRPGSDLAMKLVRASKHLTPESSLDLEGLLYPPVRKTPPKPRPAAGRCA